MPHKLPTYGTVQHHVLPTFRRHAGALLPYVPYDRDHDILCPLPWICICSEASYKYVVVFFTLIFVIKKNRLMICLF